LQVQQELKELRRSSLSDSEKKGVKTIALSSYSPKDSSIKAVVLTPNERSEY
jgi:hypothetical protein